MELQEALGREDVPLSRIGDIISQDAGMAATELGYGHIEVRNGVPHVVECVKV